MIITSESGISFEIDPINFKSSVVYSPRSKEDVIIPKEIKFKSREYKVAVISEESFKDNKKIKIINFTDDSELVSIKRNAFYCSSLTSIFIPPSLEELQDRWCALTWDLIHVSISPKNNFFTLIENKKIIVGKSNQMKPNYDVLVFACRDINQATIPSSIKRISQCAFMCCIHLDTIKFSEESELEIIEADSFSHSTLMRINIPPKVQTIAESWCKFTWNLNSVSISPENHFFKYMDNSSQKVIVKKSEENDNVYDELIFACRDIESTLIPSEIRHIASFSYQSCKNLTDVEFEENSELVSIGDFAFSSTSIEKIILPQKVERIGQFSFSNCLCIQKVDLSKNCKLESISQNAFTGSPLESITIPSSVKRIEEKAFFNCISLSKVEFSEDSELTSIEKEAFGKTAIENLVLPKHLTTIGEQPFYDRNRPLSIEFKEGSEIRLFDKKSFSADWLVKLEIPENVTEFRDEWCSFTPHLNEILISPKNKNLTYISQNKKIVAQKSNENCENFDVLLFACRDISKVSIPFNIKKIGSCSFDRCKNFKSIEFEGNSNLISIESYAFNRTNIEKVTFPKKLKFIGKCAFACCIFLKKVEFSIDSELISIGEAAFSNIPIDTVFIPNKIEKIGIAAFGKCTNLKNVEICGENLLLDDLCFNFCMKLSLLSFPNAKEISISENALNKVFEGCTLFACAKSKIYY